MRLIVVRHGIAVAKRRWDGPDADRPLTANGARQAKALAGRLARYQPTQIISSPTLRCRQTVEPLAARTGTRIEESRQLGVDAGDRAFALLHRLVTTSRQSTTVVLCTHREVLVEAVLALAEEFEVTLHHRPPGAKGAYWTFRFRGDGLASHKYTRLNR
ncbi:MAG TPA: phosphoglycerate mutase family protein [Acidimicrobiales bacterium]|nr:phosphoglycerate mutase family protein [Acidimicrobiales bacterium]